MEFSDVVNERDEVIGKASKKEIYEKLLTHRIVHILIFNTKGRMALQLQSKNKSFCPRHWNSAAAGHVLSGENYEQAALRELEEEIGVKTEIIFQHKDLYEYKNNFKKGLKKILGTFRTVFDGPFKINPREVEKVEFFTLDKIQDMIDSGEKFHPEMLFLLRKHFNIN